MTLDVVRREHLWPALRAGHRPMNRLRGIHPSQGCVATCEASSEALSPRVADRPHPGFWRNHEHQQRCLTEARFTRVIELASRIKGTADTKDCGEVGCAFYLHLIVPNSSARGLRNLSPRRFPSLGQQKTPRGYTNHVDQPGPHEAAPQAPEQKGVWQTCRHPCT